MQVHAISLISSRFFMLVEFWPLHCKFLTETKENQSVYLSEVLQSTELG